MPPFSTVLASLLDSSRTVRRQTDYYMATHDAPSPASKSVSSTAISDDGTVEPTSPEWRPSLHELLIMITLAGLSLMVALDACVVVTLLSALVSDLGLDATQGFWVGTAYLLANAVTMPVGSLLGGLARGIVLLLVGRCLQGVGGAGIIVLSLVIFTDIVPLRFRPKWYGTVLGAWALGNCAGPIIGGAIAQSTTWRWMFYLMFPFCAAG
ncbi:hypothetical protein NKR23_g12557, partial [Pleurostoma richardsiae]